MSSLKQMGAATMKLTNTFLYDQDTFYKPFTLDLLAAKCEVIIESPFITERRMNVLLPVFAKMLKRNVRIIVNTRNPSEHDGDYCYQAQEAVAAMQEMGVTVLYTAAHHRKLAIIDRCTVYEGSLNILSYSDSCEIMRKIVSKPVAKQLLKFINVHRYIKE